MQININKDYRLASDPCNIVLQKRNVYKKGKNAGQEKWESIGYYNTLEQALKGYIDKRVKSSDAESIKEMLGICQDMKAEVENIFKEIKEWII